MRRWTPDWAAMAEEHDEDRFIEMGISLGVRPRTAKKYGAAVAAFIRYLVMKNFPFDYPSFTRYLGACRRQGAQGSTLEGYRCSVLWAQRQGGTETWADCARLTRAIKGFKYADRLARPPRGAITLTMLHQLAEFDPRNSRAYALIFFLVLRKSQLIKMRSGDATLSAEGEVILTVRTDKRMKCGNVRQITSQKVVVLAAAKELIMGLQNLTPHGELLVPKFDQTKASEMIAAAAVRFGWPQGLVFDGVHCLRHGGAQAVKAFVAILLERAGNPLAMSSGMAVWYTRLNELRVQSTRVILNEGESDSEAEEE